MSQTIIEKAKRYDEIIEEIKGLLESIREDKREILEEDITSIFPELQENEDERIRKQLFNWFKGCHWDAIDDGTLKRDDIITWLEKQGEQKPQGKSAIEAIKEEKVDNQFCVKSADKVEPKFKPGDWIVWKGKYFKVNYNGCGYELTDQNGKSTSLEYGVIDKTASLWRIQDAKAGDVLYSPKYSVVECIVLIGGWKLLDGYSSLCAAITYRVKENEIEDRYTGAIWWSGVINSFYPATKEQRDTLERVMTNAGYRWNKEELKLEKI